METKFDFTELWGFKKDTYNSFVYGQFRPNMWIESEFEVDEDNTFINSFYYLIFPPSEELTNLGEELEEAMRRSSKCDKEARAGFISSDGEVCFLVNFREDNEPIVIDPNGKIIPFKSLVDVDSYGRCKLSIEGFYMHDKYMEAHMRVEQIILK